MRIGKIRKILREDFIFERQYELCDYLRHFRAYPAYNRCLEVLRQKISDGAVWWLEKIYCRIDELNKNPKKENESITQELITLLKYYDIDLMDQKTTISTLRAVWWLEKIYCRLDELNANESKNLKKPLGKITRKLITLMKYYDNNLIGYRTTISILNEMITSNLSVRKIIKQRKINVKIA